MNIFATTMSNPNNNEKPHVLRLGGQYIERIDNIVKNVDAQEKEMKELSKRVHSIEQQLNQSDYRRRLLFMSLTLTVPLILMVMEGFQIINL